MTSTPLGVAYGMGLAWGLPSLAFALWIAAATCYRRAMRNRQRRRAAEQRAARRLATTVDTISRKDWLIVIVNGRRECIDVAAETADLERWVNNPANHQEQK